MSTGPALVTGHQRGQHPPTFVGPPKNTISEKRIALYISQLSGVMFCFFFFLFDKLHIMKINFQTSFSTLVRKWIVIENWHFPGPLHSYKDYWLQVEEKQKLVQDLRNLCLLWVGSRRVTSKKKKECAMAKS